MLAGEYFNLKTIRRYTLAFAKVFSNIYVEREDPYSVVQQSFRVPLTQSSKRKFWIQLKQDSAGYDRSIAILLPRICFVLTNISLDVDRKKNSINRYKKSDPTDENKMLSCFEPMPWNLQYSMTIWSTSESDSHQILEQILPYFDPNYAITVNELPEFGIKRSIPIELNDVSYDLSMDLTEDAGSVRVVLWNLNFTLKGYLYKPIKSAAIIKKVTTRLWSPLQEEDPYCIFTEVDELEPSDAYSTEDWHIKQTVTSEGKTTEKIVEKPE
jgi:hypothetical protein